MKAINIKDVQGALDAVFHLIRDDLGVNEIPLLHDYYWNIPFDQSYRMDLPPREIAEGLDVGSLVSDLDNLNKALAEPKDKIAYQLIYASALLRYIGEYVESHAHGPNPTPETPPSR